MQCKRTISIACLKKNEGGDYRSMKEYQNQAMEEIEKVVTEIFKYKVSSFFTFHSLEHTRQVVEAAREIGNYYMLKDDDQFILLAAAWFHDTGYSTGKSEHHEQESIRLAADFLDYEFADKELIKEVSSCIQSTRMPQVPSTLLDKIICDADLFHLGTQKFEVMTERLRREFQYYFDIEFTKESWRQQNIAFLSSHKYFTDYCQKKLEPVKQQWIQKSKNTI